MTPTETVTVADYVDRFLGRPAIAVGAIGRVARAFSDGSLEGFPGEFRRIVEEAALSLEPCTPPILVRAPSHEAARAAVAPVMIVAAGDGEAPSFSYSWRTEEDRFFACPYRHDPLLLVPEKSRQEVLAAAMRSGDLAYPVTSESRAHCPWCRTRYGEALARAGGGWQELAAGVVVHTTGAVDRADGVCPGARIMAANRGTLFLPLADGADLPEVVTVMRGGGPWPPVVGLVFVPVTEDEERAWRDRPATARAWEECWFRLDAAGCGSL